MEEVAKRVIEEKMVLAKIRLADATVEYQEAVWPWVTLQVTEAFHEATDFWCYGEYSEQTGEPTLRLRKIRTANGVTDVEDDGADVADEVDPMLDWLAQLTGEDYLGWIHVAIPGGHPEWVDEREVP